MTMKHLFVLALLAFLLSGCGMLMNEAQRENYVKERDALTVLMGMVDDEPTKAQIQATIDRINKTLDEGTKGWGAVETGLTMLGVFFPGIGGLVAKHRSNVRKVTTGLFNMIDHAGGKEGRFDHSLARELMDADPKLRAAYQKFRADQELAKGKEKSLEFIT